MARFVSDFSGEQELFRSEMVSHGVRAFAEVLLDLSQAEVPVDTGDLKRSGEVIDNGNGWSVVYNSPYAAAVHDGSRPHRITAKHGGKLRFKGRDGRWVYRRSVMHPGYVGDPWLWRSVMLMRDDS